MIGNIKEKLPAKNWFVRKATFARSRVCQRRQRFMLHYSVQDNVEDVEDIKTSHNRFLTDFLEFMGIIENKDVCIMCMNYNVVANTAVLRITVKFDLNQYDLL